MRFPIWFLGTLLLLQACALAQPTAATGPAPVPSAAQPAVEGPGSQSYARRGLEALRNRLLHGGSIDEPLTEGVSRCLQAEGGEQMICAYGPSPDQPVTLVLLWPDDGDWHGQLYPQARDGIAAERRDLFAPRGCAFGCFSQVRKVRSGQGTDGPELLVVVDLGAQAESPMEEVHLLRLVNGAWEITWLPGSGDWNWGHAKVALPDSGITDFRVRSSSWWREDRFSRYFAEQESGEHRWFAERWVRKASGFMLRNQVEEPSPYSSLVRLVHFLSTADDDRAREFLGPDLGLEEAREALAQDPPRQGWAMRRIGELTFEIDRKGNGEYDLSVRFSRVEDKYKLTEIVAR